jgi:hypothetical protein
MLVVQGVVGPHCLIALRLLACVGLQSHCCCHVAVADLVTAAVLASVAVVFVFVAAFAVVGSSVLSADSEHATAATVAVTFAAVAKSTTTTTIAVSMRNAYATTVETTALMTRMLPLTTMATATVMTAAISI